MNETAILFWLQVGNTVIQTLSLIFLIVYVVKTWQMASSTKQSAEATEATVKEMRDARREATSPSVIAYFDSPPGSKIIYLVIKNIGQSTASDIKLMFRPSLTCSDPQILQHVTLLRDGIASMPPNYEIRTFLDTAPDYFSSRNLPLTYEARISFKGGLLKEYSQTRQTLDLAALTGVLSVRKKEFDDLVGEFERFAEVHKKVLSALQGIDKTLEHGIWIANPALAIADLQPNSANWQTVLFRKLDEFKSTWKLINQQEGESDIKPSEIQRYINSVANQLVTLKTVCVEYAPSEFAHALDEIIRDLYEMGVMRFHLGPEPFNRFNTLGSNVVLAIDRLIDHQSETESGAKQV